MRCYDRTIARSNNEHRLMHPLVRATHAHVSFDSEYDCSNMVQQCMRIDHKSFKTNVCIWIMTTRPTDSGGLDVPRWSCKIVLRKQIRVFANTIVRPKMDPGDTVVRLRMMPIAQGPTTTYDIGVNGYPENNQLLTVLILG